MNIHIIEIETKKTVKKIPYSSTSRARYDRGELNKLYNLYDVSKHISYLSNYEYYDFEIVDGEVKEIKEKVNIIEKTEEEKEAERLNLELRKIQKALDNPYMLVNETKSIEEEIKVLIIRHREISHGLYLLEKAKQI